MIPSFSFNIYIAIYRIYFLIKFTTDQCQWMFTQSFDDAFDVL